MGFGKPPGVPCPPRNPHCNGDVPSASIDDPIFMWIIIIVITIFVLYKFNLIPTFKRKQNRESKNEML